MLRKTLIGILFPILLILGIINFASYCIAGFEAYYDHSMAINWWSWRTWVPTSLSSSSDYIPLREAYLVLENSARFPISPIIWLIAIIAASIVVPVIVFVLGRINVNLMGGKMSTLFMITVFMVFFSAQSFLYFIGWKLPQVLSLGVEQYLNGFIQLAIAFILTTGVAVIGLASGFVTLYDFFIVRRRNQLKSTE